MINELFELLETKMRLNSIYSN